ncbi:MAG TPA: glycosyltransferase [Pyrinomonadaceae bacterium]|nr:glycosyltransferase [Pyrinomonadaceae bacterium]
MGASNDKFGPAHLDTNRVIQGLWIGPGLSVMEQLSIASFLGNGHEYHLYVYDALKNIPTGTVVRDANEILPSAKIFQYREQKSYAGFANFFRYKLLLERGGWWVDTDTICLKPFDFPEDHIFATEICRGSEVVTSGLIKAPTGSRVMAYAWDVCQTKKPELLSWGETGPRLMGEAVSEFSLEKNVKPHQTFCPLGFAEWDRVLLPNENIDLEDSYAIHLWNERWRATGQDKDQEYSQDCLYEQLKRRYL